MVTARSRLVLLGQALVVVFTVLDMVWPSHLGPWAIAAAGGVFMLGARSPMSVGLRRTVWALVLATLVLLPWGPDPWLALEKGIRIGGLISAILLSVSLLSRAAQRVQLLREVVRRLLGVPPRQRRVTLPIASQVFGGFLGFAGISMLMEAASQLPDTDLEARRECFQGISRGYAAANLWSPMYSNISILLALSPGLSWAAIFPYAVLLALTSLLLGYALDRLSRRRGEAAAGEPVQWGALARLAWPVALGMLVFLCGAVALSAWARVPIAALIVTMAPIAAVAITVYLGPQRRPWRDASAQVLQDFRGFQSLAGEVRMLMASGCAGTVIAAAIPVTWTQPLAHALAPYPMLACLFLAAAVVMLSCTSVHPILSGIVVAAAFPAMAVGLPPTAHVLAVLAGLGLAVVTTPFSVVSLTASRFSGLPLLTVSMKANLGFAAISLVLVGLILGGSASRFAH